MQTFSKNQYEQILLMSDGFYGKWIHESEGLTDPVGMIEEEWQQYFIDVIKKNKFHYKGSDNSSLMIVDLTGKKKKV